MEQPNGMKPCIWPMALAISIVCSLVGLGGCASLAVATVMYGEAYEAVTYSAIFDYDYEPDYYYDDEYDYDYGYGYGYDYDLDHPYGYGYGYEDDALDSIDLYDYEWSAEELAEQFGTFPGDGAIGPGNTAKPGMYHVDDHADSPSLPEGIYLLKGASDEVNRYTVFDVNANGTFSYRYSVVYFGDYFADLYGGQLVIYQPAAADMTMAPASPAPLKVGDPLTSGCYRVGIDIPEGTYIIGIQEDALYAALDEDTEPGAFVMDDLLFEDGSVVDSQYLLHYSQAVVTVTVKDGQYLELYAASAVPATDAPTDGTAPYPYGHDHSYGTHEPDTHHVFA